MRYAVGRPRTIEICGARNHGRQRPRLPRRHQLRGSQAHLREQLRVRIRRVAASREVLREREVGKRAQFAVQVVVGLSGGTTPGQFSVRNNSGMVDVVIDTVGWVG